MKLIILDRDGVINYDSSDYIKSPEEWHPIPGSLEAIARLNQAGYTVAIATNQSGIARGYYDLAMLASIHRKMQNALFQVGGRIDKIAFCPHHPREGCMCRKPQPGLLVQIADGYGCCLDNVPFIGDKLSDVQAAQAAGACPIFIGMYDHELQVPSYPTLSAAVNRILEE